MRQIPLSRRSSRSIRGWFLAGLVLVAAGCTSSEFPLARVSGVVTLDGEPLEGARVVFQPRAGGGSTIAGGPSYGETDADGRYSLTTHDGKPGAIVAVHRVMISTQKKQADPNGSSKVIVLVEERVPEKYHNRSKLTRTVASGGNESCDFKLLSGG